MGRGRLCLSSAPFPPPPMLAPTSTSENGFIASFRSGSECYLWGHLDGLPGSCLVILSSPHNQASSRVWVWMRPGSLPPPHIQSRAAAAPGSGWIPQSSLSPEP